MANNTSKSQLLTDKDVDKWDEYNQLDEKNRLIIQIREYKELWRYGGD